MDQLTVDYSSQSVLFPDHDVDNPSASGIRKTVWFSAYGQGSPYLPLVMVGSGYKVGSGDMVSPLSVEGFARFFGTMVDGELARPPKAQLRASCRREGNRLRFWGRLQNKAGITLGGALNSFSLGALVYEEIDQRYLRRLVRATAGFGPAVDVPAEGIINFSFETGELSGVHWTNLRSIVFADFKPGGSVLSYDMLQAARAGWLAPSDFNGDGKTDLIWQNAATRQLRIWWLDGDQFTGTVDLADSPGRNWMLVGAADLNLDGKTDLVWRNLISGDNQLWIMDGAVRLQESDLEPVADPAWQLSALTDLDRDGCADLIWRNPASGANQVWFMNGSMRLRAAALASLTDSQWILAGAGDFNQDRKPDLLWRHTGTGENRIWYLNGSIQSGAVNLDSWNDPDWQIAMVADLSGDGKTDLLWHNGQSGENQLWIMDGTQKIAVRSLPVQPDSDWKIGNIPFLPPEARLQYRCSMPDLAAHARRESIRK